MLISSAKNEKIKRLLKLRDKKGRDELKLALLEGYRAVSRALLAKIHLEELFFCKELFLGENEEKLIKSAKEQGAAIYETTKNVFAKFAYRDRPEGICATIKIPEHPLEKIKVQCNAIYLVVERIEKPGNLGSMLRSADAAGASAVIVCDKVTDIYNPNVITASTGAIFTMPIAEDTSENVIAWLKKNKIKICATSPHAEKKYTDEDFSKGAAIIIGAEQYGLSKIWLDNANSLVKIPMLGSVDSLNAATSATILLYEAARQKNWKR